MNSIKLDINSGKNLLAFSAGIDSTALFFLMIDNNIDFDIAIVNYNQREQSKDEVIYATQLAHKYNKKCFISEFTKNKQFSEKSARDFRYDFFDEIMEKEKYKSLLTAHQLNDKLEWFLMQLTKGAGLTELFGMEAKSIRNNYNLLKPLLNYSKQTLQNYLDDKNIKYFIDESNQDQKYKRNYFRHNFSDKLLDKYESGISKSFQYLQKDINSLNSNIEVEKFEQLNLYKFNGDTNLAIRIIDKDLKQRGVIISKATRDEIIKQKNIIVSHNIAISINETQIYIAPVVKSNMEKKFKERCRVKKVPQNIRAYLSTLNDDMLSSFFLYHSTGYLNLHD